MACDIDDREGESPSPMEPRLERMFHSSATGRRRERTLPEALGLRQAVQPRDDTAGSAGSQARTTRSDAAHRTSIASPARMRDTNSRTDRIRGRRSQNALRFKILRRPNRREGTHITAAVSPADAATDRRYAPSATSGSLEHRNAALLTATVTAALRAAVRLGLRPVVLVRCSPGNRTMRGPDLSLSVRGDRTDHSGRRTLCPRQARPRLFNKGLRRAEPACHRESVRAAECQLSTPRTTVNRRSGDLEGHIRLIRRPP